MINDYVKHKLTLAKKNFSKFENHYNPYKYHIRGLTKKYQMKYKFDMLNQSSHNNQADAFKHAFMAAECACFISNDISEYWCNKHEITGKKGGQPIEEYYMDLWNNQVGRDIGLKVDKELKYITKIQSIALEKKREIYYDEIAKKVMRKMKTGELITGLNDKRIEQLKKEFENDKSLFSEKEISDFIKKKYPNSSPTGYASEIDDNTVKLENRVFHNKEVDLAKTANKEITSQVLKQYFENGNKMPSEEDLKAQVASGDLIYVDNYTRSDGTKVSGYYRRR